MLLLAAPSFVPSAAPTSFVLDVEPWLQKQGCSSAYCHGSATGRKGFKLSLFGGDPRADWQAITQDLGGRRIDLVRAEHSLVLQKPSLALRHGGGRKLPADGAAYAMLARWIREGARFDPETAVDALRIVERDGCCRAIATVGGSERDVTASASWTSSDPSLATIDGDGRVERHGPGRVLLVARFAGAEATRSEVVPFGPGPGLGLVPAPDAGPDRLARRLWLDLAGRLPDPIELERFTSLPASERVPRTVTELVGAPAFDTVFAGHLASWFEIPPGDARQLVRLPLDGFVRRLLALRTFLEKREDPRDRAELFARSLLGLRIGCARCHDHPLDRWKRSEHLAFSACFASPRPRSGGSMGPGVLFDPDSGTPVTARLLPLRGATTSEHRDVVTFALETARETVRANFANRVLALLLGHGAVEPVDDLRPSNPASEPEWLVALAKQADDLPSLVRAIVTSPEYRRDSEPDAALDHGGARVRHFARREARELPPRLLVRAIASALGVPLEVELPAEPLARELALANGTWLADAVARSGLAHAGLDELFLRTLSRHPSDAERAAFADEDRVALACALFRSREFRSLR